MKMTTWKSGAAISAVALTALLLPAAAVADPDPDAVAETVAQSGVSPTPLAGKKVFLDPGHQGTGHSEDLSRQVDDGRGGTKDCQTTGMTTLGGVAEHTIAWDISQLVKAGLEKLGAEVELSRQDDTGWGGCVDERARAANAFGADLAVSVHADSTVTGEDAGKRGFHLIVPTLPVPDATVDEVQSGEGRVATDAVRDAYLDAGFTPANYAGVVDGIQSRADIAGPALATVPLVFLEMGNGSNPDDAAILESQEGRLKHAVAIIVGAVDYLMGATGVDAAATTPAATTPTAATVVPTTIPLASAPTTAVSPTATADDGAAEPSSTPHPLQTTTTKPPATPQVDTGQSPVTALTQGLVVLQTLLAEFGLDGLEEFATAENLGVVADLLTTLLKVLG